MDFRILGPLEVRDGDREVRLRGGKQRALLALLLVNANRTLAIDRIVDELWGADVPETAQKMVQIYVSHLRKVLPPGALHTRPPGYVLALEHEQLDLHRFEALVAEARAALDAGCPQPAVEGFREALSLWRGPALAEFSSEPFGPPEAARLEELRLYALEGRLEADLLLGRHNDVAGELEALVARHPLREGLRRRQMLSLYRSGRQAEALATYQEARRVLADELGIEPSPALRELERRILQQDPGLDLAPLPPAGETLASAPPRSSAAVRPAAPLLEREAELAAIRALVEETLGGAGRFVVIEAGAGMGKTRLLAEARALATAAEMGVLSARGGELEDEFAYGIVRQLFEPALAVASAEVSSELLAGAAGLAAPLFDEGRLAEALEGAADTSFATLHGLYWLVANIASRRPTAIVIDDVHWADAASLRWLAYLARRLEGLPLLVIAATRSPEQSRHGQLLTELAADPDVVVLAPRTLTLESVRTLARDVFGVDADGGFCAACHRATGGNPLYLRALLVTLESDGVRPSPEAAARVFEVGPEPVARAVSLRLSRLSAEAGALARAVSVLDQGAELGRAAVLVGLEPETAREAANALTRAELLRLEPDFEFTHPVVRAVVYNQLDPSERAAAHRRAAELLAEAGAEPEQAAAHLQLVPPAGDPFVPPVLLKAGRRALARGAPKASLAYLRRALAEPPSAPERVDVLLELGMVERGLDLAAAIEHLTEAVGLADDPVRRARVSLECGRVLVYAGDRNAEALQVFRRALERLPPELRDEREVLETELLASSWWDPLLYPAAKELLAWIREDKLGGGYGTDLLFAALAHYEQRRGVDRARAISLATRSIESGRVERGSEWARYYAGDAFRTAGEFEAGRAFYDRALADARRRGDVLNVGGLLVFRGALVTDQGDLRSPEPDLRDGLEFAAQYALPLHVMYAATFLADLLLERGDLAETESVLARAALPKALPESVHFIFFLSARGTLRLAQGEPQEALDDFTALGRIAEKMDIQNPAYRPWRSRSALALHALGRRDEALQLASEELELSRRWAAPRTVGISLRVLGVVEGGDAGEARLREAVDVLAPSAARLEHAKVLVELGASLRRRNGRSDAVELLRDGHELAHACGATSLVERAASELVAAGAKPRRVVQTGVDSLTASERRIAAMAAEGMSDKEVAQALFVTVKTVEMELSSVYRKLEINSRKQFTDVLQALPQEAAV